MYNYEKVLDSHLTPTPTHQKGNTMKALLIILTGGILGIILLIAYACCYVSGKCCEAEEQRNRAMGIVHADRKAMAELDLSDNMDRLNAKIKALKGTKE